MLLTTEVEIRWNPNNKKHYTSKGYEFTKLGEFFIANIEDVTKGSEVEVMVMCDYCEKEYIKTYYKYNLHRKDSVVENDCCADCKKHKVKEVFIENYGVDNPMKTEDVQKKVAKTMKKRYGFTTYAKTDTFKINHSGKNNHSWKGGITSQYMKDRTSIEQKEWRLNVFTRDGFKCVACGNKKSGNFNAHHILNFAERKDLINDVNNGITLCKDCHKEFHMLHGYKNNNKDQLKEFINHKKDVETIETTA